MKSRMELLKADNAATCIRMIVVRESHLEFKPLASLSLEEIEKAQTDKALVLFRKRELGVIRDFALAQELTQGQKIKTISQHGIKSDWVIQYLATPEVQLLRDVVSAFANEIPIKARRNIERRVFVLKPYDKKIQSSGS